MKDNFSQVAHLYSRFRPGYPQQLYDFLIHLVQDKINAWDCGTGNGQVASGLAEYFNAVYAIDISDNQLANAVKKKNIFYSLKNAEQVSFPDKHFDLITVAQAIHWFNFEHFYKEAQRTLKPNGILAVFGYNLFRISPEIDALIDDFYKNVTGPYWDKERKYVDEKYATIPFPFHELKAPVFTSEYNWEADHVIGYLNTWSAVQHFINANRENPVDKIIHPLKKMWGKDLLKKVSFEIFMRVGRNNGELKIEN